MARRVEIEVGVDSRAAERGFKSLSKSAKDFRGSLNDVSVGAASSTKGLAGFAALARGPGLAIGIGVAAKTAFDLANAAGDMNEQVSKSRQVFGAASSSLESWSKTTASSIGIARTAALEAAGTFGNLFNTVGVAGERASEMSRSLVKLAADLASFNNADPSEVLEALRSGLIGEAEPLRRFGVLLSEARVQQRAMADTGKLTAASLTGQERALARYEIILSDTSKAQGDFARTSSGLANQQRILAAQAEDLKVKLGQGLVPVLTELTAVANDSITASAGLGGELGKLGVTAGGLGTALKGAFLVTPGLGLMLAETKLLADHFRDAKKAADDYTAAAAKAFGATSDPLNALAGAKRAPGVAAPSPRSKVPSFGEPGFTVAKAPPVPLGPTVEMRNQWFDSKVSRALDRAQDGSLKQQVTKLKAVSAMISARIAVTKDITRKLRLEDELLSVNRQRKGVEAQISAAADARAKAIRAAATKQAKALSDAAATIAKGVAAFGKGLTGDLPKGQVTTPRAKFHKANVSGILSASGLDPDQVRRTRQKLSQVSAGGFVPNAQPAFAGGRGGGQSIVVESNLYVDGKKLQTVIKKHARKDATRRTAPRRGPYAGRD